MKTTFLTALTTATFISLSGIAHADSVREIIDGIEKEKAAKLETYLKANPKADDRLDGISHLVAVYANLEKPKKAMPLLQEKYKLLTEGTKIEDLDLTELLPGTVQPMILSMAAAGDRDGAKALIAKVKKDLASHEMASQIIGFLDGITAQINAPGGGDVLEIAFTDLFGHKVDLAAMKGKVVLIDFWATWCGPCIAELPNVLAAYKKHHDKGFEIIGISLDQDEAALKSFIKDNNMPWPQYFDGQGWKNSIAQKYSVTSIPATYLIGKNGKVVGSNLRGAQLEAEVARQLKGE